MPRDVYTKEFLERYKSLYSRWGRDSDCVDTLRSEFMSQYPSMSVSTLTALRSKRSKEFEKARQAHISKILHLQGTREQDLLIRAKELNSEVVDRLITWQDVLLSKIDSLDSESEEYFTSISMILGTITQVQEKINAFSGYDLTNSLQFYKQKLIAKRIASEESIDRIIEVFSLGQSVGGIKVEGPKENPKITFIKEGSNERE